MNKKMTGVHQKRSAVIGIGKKRESEELESWVIEEYYIPYQAS